MYLSEEQLVALNPVTRFLYEKDSAQAFADGLINLPVLVLAGDDRRECSDERSHIAICVHAAGP